ncbi:LON peptidase substrate-binding domain-containing protein [Ectothiorhodospiraceae bacterium 2226]|nr:LON peptidase substrate-binding domain-containing protein [Ectothiorhodospiraceae bacterium 2226]
MSETTIPLFPLHAVLFPEGALPLRIFESRYLDMISECLRTECGFGVCLIREGSEVGPAAKAYEVGTLSRISYWHKRKDGLLGVTAVGEQRFRILDQEVRTNQVTVARVALIENEPAAALPEKHQPLADFLREIMAQLGPPHTTRPQRLDDAGWVGGRLCELLPLPLSQKQYLLQLSDPLERLDRLAEMLRELAIRR